MLLFSPDHFVDDAHVALDDFYYFGADVFINVVGDGDAVVAIFAELDGGVNGLQKALGVDAGYDEVPLVDGFGTLGGGADADCREGMANRGEEAALLGEGAAVAHYGEGVHLQAVVVVEAEGLVLDDTLVEFEAAGGKAVAAARVATVEDGHVVLLCHFVDGVEER